MTIVTKEEYEAEAEKEKIEKEKLSAKQTKQALNEYQKSLKRMRELEDLTKHPAWARRTASIRRIQRAAEEGLKHGEKKDFDRNQATFIVCDKFFEDLSDECDKHNALIESPGHLPLWRDPEEPPVRAVWDDENLTVGLYADDDMVIDDEVAEAVEESNAEDEGATE